MGPETRPGRRVRPGLASGSDEPPSWRRPYPPSGWSGLPPKGERVASHDPPRSPSPTPHPYPEGYGDRLAGQIASFRSPWERWWTEDDAIWPASSFPAPRPQVPPWLGTVYAHAPAAPGARGIAKCSPKTLHKSLRSVRFKGRVVSLRPEPKRIVRVVAKGTGGQADGPEGSTIRRLDPVRGTSEAIHVPCFS